LDNSGNTVRRKTEIRFDPLTKQSARIVPSPGLDAEPPDYSEAIGATAGANCIFCAENMRNVTPVFSSDITAEGRIFHNSAVVFPNLFPYGKHNAVVIFSQSHVVDLRQMDPKTVADAFRAAQMYIQKVRSIDADAKYCSVNWNYLPESGGSILHPHVQVLISDLPTNYQREISARATEYKAIHGSEYLVDLCSTEKAAGNRWVGEEGNISWVHAFAPLSHNDFIGVFPTAMYIDDLQEADWLDLAASLLRLVPALREQGFASFNLALHVSLMPNQKQPTHVRLIPRVSYGALHTSDINFLQGLHGEAISYKMPEEVAQLARRHFAR